MASVKIWGSVSLKEGHPDDPRDKYYLTVCFVCHDMAKPGQEHLRNYGGIVCYSCRAFWRRSHQNTRRPNFVCKKNEDCTITVTTRRRCQKCRYERCIVAGMNPDAVLNDDQKKVRFRKLLMKRQKQLAKQMKAKQKGQRPMQTKKLQLAFKDFADTDETESMQSQSDTSEDSYPQLFCGTSTNFTNYLYNPPQQLYHPEVHQLQPTYHTTYSAVNLTMEPRDNRLFNLSTRDEMFQQSPSDDLNWREKVPSIVDAYVKVMTTMRCHRTDHLLAQLYAQKSGYDNPQVITKGDIQFLVYRLSQAFEQFSMSLRDFVSLEIVDQEKLLSRNTPLFVQFFLGHNFLVETRHKNMEEQSKKKVWMTNFAQKLFLERFNSTTKLFVDGTDLDEYGRLILKLKGLPELVTCEQMAVLAYILLLHSGDGGLKHHEEMFNSYIRSCDDCLSMPNFISTLTSMANFSADNFDWNENEWHRYLAT